MGTPTREQFDQWLALAGAKLDRGKRHLPPRGTPVERIHVLRFLSEQVLERAEAERSLSEHDVGRWIDRTPEIAAAQEIVHRSRRARAALLPAASDIEVVADGLFARAERTATLRPHHHDDQDENVRSALFWQGLQNPRGPWLWSVISALAEYFDKGAGSRAVKARRDLDEAVAKLQAVISGYNSAVAALDAMDLTWLCAERAEKLRAISLPALIPPDLFPLERSRNADERLFVYRAWRVNWSTSRAAHAKAIEKLMSIDGFRSQYSERRNIEKLCKGFMRQAAAVSRAHTGS